MSAEGVRELCFINAVMNSHTTVWCNTKTWNRRCSPPPIPCIIGYFSTWQWRYWFFQGENPSVEMYFTQSYRSWAAVEDSVETSGAQLSIKDQSIQWGLPPGVKQDRCEHLSWTCTLSAKKCQSSLLKVLEDILTTRILYICWNKSRVYSFLQSFI